MRSVPESAVRPRWFCPARRAPRQAALALCLALAPTVASGQDKPPPADAIDRLEESQVVAVLGLTAKGIDGKELGRIVDVLVDGAGRPQAAVIDVGGFLGMGSRKVAVDWSMLHFSMGKAAAVTLAVPSTVIKSAPAYDPAKPVQAVALPQRAAPEPPAAPPK